MSKLSSIFTANRIAALAAFLTGIASALVGIESSLPTAAANAVAEGVGILGSVATCLHFMLGAQKSEANQAQITMGQLQVQHAQAMLAHAALTQGDIPTKTDAIVTEDQIPDASAVAQGSAAKPDSPYLDAQGNRLPNDQIPAPMPDLVPEAPIAPEV